MKRVVFIGFIISLLIGSCAQQEVKSPNEGAWKVVHWIRVTADTLQWEFPANFTGSEMKVWSKNHFAFSGRYKMDTVFIDNCGGGSYKLEGTHYEESYLYFLNAQSLVGTSQRLLLEVKNDTLIQTWPVNENWQVDRSNYNIQKLIKLE
ncbi:MAG TPA: hypothetical protein PK521_06720 [Bacteroidales bacterium]|jgi:hypothetical protein|nr:hypothetical protein [Bacteroidales bacterium]